MYICICNAVTDRDIKQAVDDGANCMSHLQERLNVGRCCGKCADAAGNCMDKHMAKQLDQNEMLSF